MIRKHLIHIWMLLALLFPQVAGAVSYMKEPASYTAMMSGKNTIDLSLPPFDYYRIGKKRALFHSDDPDPAETVWTDRS